VKRHEKPEECEGCGWPTKQLEFHGSGRGTEDEGMPFTQADHWFCRVCSSGMAFEVHQGRVSHAIAQAFNVLLERIDSLEARARRLTKEAK
jgi:hypothetical protein